ncbi:hypothetical protein [Larkinella terrae]|uniref:Uncharacterized protein n=1 Tax=Larkinella terrae TaxID=2025311 RepID=A0A7K0EP39_9BACT|nr:hypothetical protein [Larkinella terrae]MRS63218.1 hypothetical protein [Larkinella terrae]
MNAIRKIIQRQGRNTITVELPEDFEAETIEMILLPVEDPVKEALPELEGNLTELQKLLLKAPSMTVEEMNEIEEKRNALNQWPKKSA